MDTEKQQNKVYLIHASHGSYDEYVQYVVAACKSNDGAEKYLSKLQSSDDNIKIYHMELNKRISEWEKKNIRPSNVNHKKYSEKFTKWYKDKFKITQELENELKISMLNEFDIKRFLEYNDDNSYYIQEMVIFD